MKYSPSPLYLYPKQKLEVWYSTKNYDAVIIPIL